MAVSSRARTVSTLPAAPTLTGDARVEICIAGAGVAGMIAAYLLARAKRSVMVVDEGAAGGPRIGEDMTQLAGVLEQPYRDLERRYGIERTRIAAQSFSAAIDSIEAIVRRERIACEFERLDGYCLAGAADAREDFEREAAAAARAGRSDVQVLDVPPIEGAVARPCVRYPAQALLHPARFAAGLARAIAQAGGRIHGGVGTRAVEAGRVASLLTTAGHRIQADVIVTPGAVAAGGVRAGTLAHVIGLRMPRGAVTRALYWDGGGRRCARLRAQGVRGGDVLLVAGHGDDAIEAPPPYEALEAWARERFPAAREVVQRFSGERLRTADIFAFAGHEVADSDSLYVNDPSGGTAMTRAVIAGMVIRDFVEGARTPWAEPNMPSACYTAAARPAAELA